MLTTAQQSIFNAAIQADAALVAARAAKDLGVIAAYYNAPGSGTIWRPDVSMNELNTAIVWSEFAVLLVTLQNTYLAMVSVDVIDATSANIRGGFATVFGPATASRANLLALVQRTPTRFEALFATAQVSSLYGHIVTVEEVSPAV